VRIRNQNENERSFQNIDRVESMSTLNDCHGQVQAPYYAAWTDAGMQAPQSDPIPRW
jgi:hypothetical protein